MRHVILIILFVLPQLSVFASGNMRKDKPNIIVILTDDQGYADVGFQGDQAKTPHLDSLAKDGIRFTNGYVTHPFCSPMRAGFMAGRYQHRFGHENNPTHLPNDSTLGLPMSEVTIADSMKAAGYHTIAVGKWHLGAHPKYHPNNRGFDDYFGFLGGGHDYFKVAKKGQKVVEYNIPIEHNNKPVPMESYLTDMLNAAAVKFINQYKGQPFFMYLAYNAPHTPYQCSPKYIKRFEHLKDPKLQIYLGMIAAVDDGVGQVRAALKANGLTENTLIIYLSDNGGQTKFNVSKNTPLRGRKGNVYEGGVRVPFVMTWPGMLEPGVYHQPVSSLDIYPTAVSLAGGEISRRLEGVDLMPYLQGKNKNAPHDYLYWRVGGGGRWAVRHGKWKLAKETQKIELFNLEEDISEKVDLAGQHPDVVRSLKEAYDLWNKKNIQPLWESPKPGKPRKPPVKSEKKS